MKKIFFTLLMTLVLLKTSFAQNTWSQKADFGGGSLAGATAFTIGNKGYMGSGFNTLTGEPQSSFWEYNQDADTWSQKADMGGNPRGYTIGFSIDTKGYVGGGYDNEDLYNDFWEYNPANNSWVQKANIGGPARLNGSSFSINDKGYVGLGYDFDTDTDLKDFWEYNPINNVWTEKATFAGREREGAASFSIGDLGYIGTGYDYENDVDLQDFWSYDPSSNSWSIKAPFGGIEREYASGFNIGNNGYITCGYSYEDDQILADLWQYNPSDDAWTQKAVFPGSSRQIASAFSINNKGYLSCGYNFDTELNDLWQYSPSGSNNAPVANAGENIVIQLPVNTANLFGTGTDSDGSIVSYEWSQDVNNPSSASISDPSIANPVLSNLIEGIYIFYLTVTDNDGDTDTDEVQVTVNAAGNQDPIANAGVDINLVLPVNATDLDGSGTDADGNIVSYNWEQVGNTPSQATVSDSTISNPVVSDLIEGTYTFLLTVTDDEGATSTDEVDVIVSPEPNMVPIVDAGIDTTIIFPTDSVQLAGSATDPDGIIVTYEWLQSSGPSLATISDPTITNPIVNGLVTGLYTFILTATDDSGDSASDEVVVNVVDTSFNFAPIADTGLDTTLILPADSIEVIGSGTDVDGIIVSYDWAQIGDQPSIATISDTSITNPIFSDLIMGTYSFIFTVTDNEGGIGTDTLNITVVDTSINILPIADAGFDMTIIFPTDSIEVNGSGTDVDGIIVSYDWAQVGDLPSVATISDTAILNPLFSDLILGTYTFVLTVTDNEGGIAMDTVNIMVIDTVPNIAPIADAGLDITIILPTDSIEINGGGTDIDGVIVSYDWAQLGDMPSVATISDTAIANPLFSDLILGTYTFVLTVTDDDGAIGTDTVNITVIDSVTNEAPIADAGLDITITLPTDSVNISGSGTDVDGTIVSYFWEQVGNTPSIATISDDIIQNPTFSDLVEGTYTFVLTVTDDDGATGSDTAIITVIAPANIAPIADAGEDISLLLPTNFTSLNGSGTDADGTIVSYAWEQVGSTPSNATIVGASTGNPLVASLVKGTYTFRLTVTDNDGAIGSDEVNVIVDEDLTTDPINFIAPSIYPNPAPNGKVIVEMGNNIKIGSKMSLNSIDGKSLEKFTITSTKQQIDLSKYPSGLYILQFENGAKAKVIIMQ